ncbi:hypothetical protein K5M36_08810 [Chromobacterium vaccinii]|nr:hypothetical protein [Chromobacterium vaccinii]
METIHYRGFEIWFAGYPNADGTHGIRYYIGRTTDDQVREVPFSLDHDCASIEEAKAHSLDAARLKVDQYHDGVDQSLAILF